MHIPCQAQGSGQDNDRSPPPPLPMEPLCPRAHRQSNHMLGNLATPMASQASSEFLDLTTVAQNIPKLWDVLL